MLLQEQSREMKMYQATKNAVMVIGGAEDKIHGCEILHTFFCRSGARNARIAIIPSASREPVITGARYLRIFEEMGAKQVELLDIQQPTDCKDADIQDYLEACTGVFLTGGDQLRLCSVLANTSVLEIIRERVKQGQITLAGTSAGAAVMGQHMIAGGGSGESPNRSLVDMAMGLSILPNLIVDQHFHNRNRMGRLISAIAGHPDQLGVGIDEDTCAIFEDDGLLQVIGKGTVTIVDPGEVCYTNEPYARVTDPLSIHSLRLHILSHGDRYYLQQQTLLAPIHQLLTGL